LTDGGAICDAMCATADLLRPVVTMLTIMLIVDITVFGLPNNVNKTANSLCEDVDTSADTELRGDRRQLKIVKVQ